MFLSLMLIEFGVLCMSSGGVASLEFVHSPDLLNFIVSTSHTYTSLHSLALQGWGGAVFALFSYWLLWKLNINDTLSKTSVYSLIF